MNVREAILKAADHIERNPREFDFDTCDIPSCGSPGCVLGWIGFFSGVDYSMEIDPANAVAEKYLRLPKGGRLLSFELSAFTFYDRMDDLGDCSFWRIDNEVCASALRVYADKFHPEEKTQLPESILSIFRERQNDKVAA